MERLEDGNMWGFSETLYEANKRNVRVDGYWITKKGSKTNFMRKLNIIRNGEDYVENWIYDRVSIGANKDCVKLLEQFPDAILLVEHRTKKILKRFDMNGKLLDDLIKVKLF